MSCKNENCSALVSVDIPKGVTIIDRYVFCHCKNLTSITIPNTVKSISDYAFQDCSRLSSISIPYNVTSIDKEAFRDCSLLKDVYCYSKNVPFTGDDVFTNVPLDVATLHVPYFVLDKYKAQIPWSQFGYFDGMTEGIEEPVKCAAPTITMLANGNIKVESATEGATCVTNVTTDQPGTTYDKEIKLNDIFNFTVTAYATAEGYDDSDVTTATFKLEKTVSDMNGDGVTNIADVIQLVNIILQQ